MAVLQATTSRDYLPPCPAGTFAAICVKVDDKFGVTRRKYQSEELETVNLTSFTFQFVDGDIHQVRSRDMLISAHEKSALLKFLTQWLGGAPKMGWDYCAMEGQPALISVTHTPRTNGEGVFCNIASIMPLPKGMPVPTFDAPVEEPPAIDADGDVDFGPTETPVAPLPVAKPQAARPAAARPAVKAPAPAARRPAPPANAPVPF